MDSIQLGSSGLDVSAIGLGCMHMHTKTTAEAVKVIAGAVNCGVNFFDHADIYGDGESERVFGQALRQSGISRHSILLQSKCGIRDGWYDLSKKHILQAVEGSLRRLGTDYLDVLLLHRPDALMEPEEVAEAFNALQNSGKVRQFGVSNQHSMQIELLQAHLHQRIMANQLRFSPVHSGMVDCGVLVNTDEAGAAHKDGMVLDYCRLNAITIQGWSPFRYGETGDEGVYLGSSKFPRLNEVIDRLAAEKQLKPETVVTGWILRHPAGMQMLAGTMNPGRLEDICKASSQTLTRQEWYQLYHAAGHLIP